MGWLTAAALLAHICGTRLTEPRTTRCNLGTLQTFLELKALIDLPWPGTSMAIDAAMFRGFLSPHTSFLFKERRT
jgi:hypothetical protein